MRDLKTLSVKQPQVITVSLKFAESLFNIKACIIQSEVIFLCDDCCFLLQGWLMEHPQEALALVRLQDSEVKRIKIFVNSHKV